MILAVRTVAGRAYGGAAQPPLILRSEGTFNRRAYDRDYYHRTRKARLVHKPLTAAQRKHRNAARRARYIENQEAERAAARERYRSKARRTA